MAGSARECQFCPRLTGNDIDNGERQIEIFENGTLLDVKFKVAECIRRRLRIGNTVRLETEALDGVAQRPSGGVGAIEQRHIKRTRERPAAQKWRTEPNA